MIGDFDINMIHHTLNELPHWAQYAYQGIADSSIAAAAPDVAPEVVCPGFGEPGWAPFCFLNGNPVFKMFDVFQAFIQSSVVSTHDIIAVSGSFSVYV